MARKLSINGDGRAIAARIARLESFTTHGNMHGVRVTPNLAWLGGGGWLRGTARDRWQADRDTIDYVVWSYDTPILWHAADGWVRIGHSFSAASSKHQSRAAMYRYAGTATDSWYGGPVAGFDTRETLLQVSYRLSDAQLRLFNSIGACGEGSGVTPVRTRDITGQASRTLAVLYRLGLVESDAAGVITITAAGAEVWA
jgi:hypothetical protein